MVLSGGLLAAVEGSAPDELAVAFEVHLQDGSPLGADPHGRVGCRVREAGLEGEGLVGGDGVAADLGPVGLLALVDAAGRGLVGPAQAADPGGRQDHQPHQERSQAGRPPRGDRAAGPRSLCWCSRRFTGGRDLERCPTWV